MVVAEHYLPGFRAGGPIRSITALVQEFGAEIDFFILTRDRDAGCDEPFFPDDAPSEWQTVGGAQVRYLAPGEITLSVVRDVVRRVQPVALYLNSVFARLSLTALMAHRLGMLGSIRVLLAPRGELSPGALALKALKKRVFLRIASLIRLHNDLVVHASTEMESAEIRRVWSNADVIVAQNLTARKVFDAPSIEKVSGQARFVYLSRLSPKKNLLFALSALSSLPGTIELNIFGPIADREYWTECERAMGSLPPNVTAVYHGVLAPDDVIETLSRYHFFLLPTASENFGHAIVEAMQAGCVPLISDQTPWTKLEQSNAGWAMALDRPEDWHSQLIRCLEMSHSEYARHRQATQAYAKTIVAMRSIDEHRTLLQTMIGHQPLENGTN